MSLSKSSVQQRGGFYLQQELQDCSPMTHFPEWLKTLLSMKSLQVASLPMPGRWQFFCSPASFYHGSFPPKTLKSPVSCLVTINAHFLSCFKPETTSFALFFASPTAPPAFSARNCFPVVHLPDVGWEQCSSCDPSLHGHFSCVSKWGGFWCSPQHPLNTTCPFHHLQELFHVVYATFRPQIPIFHQDPLT